MGTPAKSSWPVHLEYTSPLGQVSNDSLCHFRITSIIAISQSQRVAIDAPAPIDGFQGGFKSTLHHQAKRLVFSRQRQGTPITTGA
jgi:hypothetical protein